MKYNQFKVRILNEKVNTPTTTVYRCGPLIDLCRGPHVRHTGKIKAFKLTKNSSSYWEGDSNRESLQRIYGISFPDNKQLKEWEHFQEEAAKRNHRKIGQVRTKLPEISSSIKNMIIKTVCTKRNKSFSFSTSSVREVVSSIRREPLFTTN